MSVRDHQNGDGGKHWKDRKRWQLSAKKRTGASVRGAPNGATGTVVAVSVKTEEGRTQPMRVRREEAFDFVIPQALRERLQHIRVKVNYETDNEGEHITSQVVVLSFRGGYQQVIKGLLQTPPDARDFGKRAWTHVTIQMLPDDKLDEIAGKRDWNRDPNYEERDMRITWWRRGAGGHHRDGKDGEVVKELCDELNVLQWLVENDLEALYTIGYLRGLLPLRDEDRERLNSIAAQAHTLWGVSIQPHAEHEFHRARLWHRLAWLVGEDHQPELADEETVLERYGETEIGGRTTTRYEEGSETGQRFYVNHEKMLAIAIYHWPNYREMIVVDLTTNEAIAQPLEETGQGLSFLEDVMLGKDFEEITDIKFHDLIVASHAGDFAAVGT